MANTTDVQAKLHRLATQAAAYIASSRIRIASLTNLAATADTEGNEAAKHRYLNEREDLSHQVMGAIYDLDQLTSAMGKTPRDYLPDEIDEDGGA